VSRLRTAALLAAVMGSALLPGCGALHDNARPVCRYGSPMVLMAQSVPTATLIPCVRALPLGWHFRSFDAESGQSEFVLDSDFAGARALVVTLLPRCDIGAFSPEPSDEPGAARYQMLVRNRPVFEQEWGYTFAGGCAIYRFTLREGDSDTLSAQIGRGVSFLARRTIQSAFQADTGHPLDPAAASS
jgi:hypothetical protein